MGNRIRTLILLFGKVLITLSFLCPIQFTFLFSPLIECDMPSTMWGEWLGYWRPLFGSLILGFLLCVLSKHTPKHCPEEPLDFKHSPLAVAGIIIILGILLITAIIFLIFLLIGLYYIFISEYMPILLPICVGAGVVGSLLYLGWKVYKNNK